MLEEKIVSETYVLLQNLIQNACVNPPGNEVKSINTIKEFLHAKGIECTVFETAPNRANLLARIKGSENGPIIMFGPSHIDVVPVPNPQDWSVAPFSGEMKDGFIWGRGAMDMLFIVAAQVQAFAQLHTEGFQPKGDLLLFIVADEEAGGTFGVKWMIQNHPDLIETDYCLSETGGAALAEGRLIIMIGEKGGSMKRIHFKGTPGHGSMPYGSDNAVVKASQAILRIQDYCDNKIPITTEYIGHLVDGLGMSSIQKFMLTTKRLLPMTLKMLKKKDPDTAKVIHGLSRMTMSPNVIKGGIKPNVIAANASISVDIRTLPGQDEAYVISHLRNALGDLASEAEIVPITEDEGGIESYGNASVVSSEFVSTLESAICDIFPDSHIVPFLMPAVSDLRYFRERGAQCYGFALMDPETSTKDMTALPHGTDERIRKHTVELTLNVYYNLAKKWEA